MVPPCQVTAQRIKAAQSQDAASKQFLEASTVFGSGLVGISLGLIADIYAGNRDSESLDFGGN